jgi:hypothetical protein
MLTLCFVSNNSFLLNSLSFCYCSKFFLPSFLLECDKRRLDEWETWFYCYYYNVFIFLWFFPRCPITCDMQLLSLSPCVNISPQFKVLSIDRIINLSQSVSIVIECGGILNLTQPHTKTINVYVSTMRLCVLCSNKQIMDLRFHLYCCQSKKNSLLNFKH